MKFHGRNIDPLSFWSNYVEFPTRMETDSEFSDLVFCPNPAHDNYRTPSFQVNLQKPLVHCFSYCGVQGTWEHAVCMIEGLYEQFQIDAATSKQDRLRRVHRAHRAAKRIILRGSAPSKQIYRRTPAGERKPVEEKPLDFETFLPPVARQYLQGRGITEDSIAFWGIGWDPENKRVVIPVQDERDKLKLLIKRAIFDSQRPKYLYSEDSVKTEILFGASKIPMKPEYVVLTEGSTDVIALNQHGIPAVGILGTGISREQVKILSRLRPKKVYLMFDKDTAGVRNIEIAMERLRKYPLFVCRYPKGKSDPAELSEKEALRSIERAVPIALWRSALQNRPRDAKIATVRTSNRSERV